ncbi:MAG: hypothetical protein AAGC85_06845 [Bacteroidota bacterium]
MEKLPLALIFCFLSTWASIYACECTEPEDLQSRYDQADYVFTGTVVGLNTNWISGGWKFSFKVEQSWKKSTSDFLIINTGWEDQDCGYIFEEGESYLVYVTRKFTPKTRQCVGNMRKSEAAEVLAWLGEGQAPERNSMAPAMFWIVGALGALSVIFIAFVVLKNKIAPAKT